MVCSTTLGPANPMRLFGSAMMMSPSDAKLAVTPPKVGSHSMDMNRYPVVPELADGSRDLCHLHQ